MVKKGVITSLAALLGIIATLGWALSRRKKRRRQERLCKHFPLAPDISKRHMKKLPSTVQHRRIPQREEDGHLEYDVKCNSISLYTYSLFEKI